MINSRDLGELNPTVQAKCKAFIQLCKEAGIDVLITSTYRDDESQDALYAKGRTAPGPIVTNAKGGESFHNYRVAFDFVPIVDGKAQWNDSKLFECCGKLAESVGLEWAGKWAHFKELAHCQLTGGKTLAQLKGERNGT